MIERPRPFKHHFGLWRQQALHLVKTATVGYFGLHTLCRDIPPCMSIGGCVYVHRGMRAFRTYTGVCPYGERISIGGLRVFRIYTGVCPYGGRMPIGGCVYFGHTRGYVHTVNVCPSGDVCMSIGGCVHFGHTRGYVPKVNVTNFSCKKKKKMQHFSTFRCLRTDIQRNKRVLEGCSKGAKVLQEAVLSLKTHFFLSFSGKNRENTCTNGILFVTLYRLTSKQP